MKLDVSHMKKSILKRTLFSVFLVLILAVVFAAPVSAEESSCPYCDCPYGMGCDWCHPPGHDGIDFWDCHVGAGDESEGSCCTPGEPEDSGRKYSSNWLRDPAYKQLLATFENGGTAEFEIKDLILFYVTMPAGYEGQVLLISKTAMELPDFGVPVAAADITVTPEMKEGEEAIITAKIPYWVLEGNGVSLEDLEKLVLVHFVNGEWVEMEITITVDEEKEYVIIEGKTTSFSPFVVVYDENKVAGDKKEDTGNAAESPAPILGVLAGLCAVAALRRR